MSVVESSWRKRLEQYIREQARPAEKFGHQPRLYALTQVIGKGLKYDDDVVYAAAWLHDLGVFMGHRPEEPEALARWDNVVYAMTETPALLAQFGFPADKVQAVLECIRTHQPSAEPLGLEATLLRDADILEQLGAVGISRTVCKVGRDTRFTTFSDAQKSLQRALDDLPAKLRLPGAIALAQERVRVHREFLDALRREAGENLF